MQKRMNLYICCRVLSDMIFTDDTFYQLPVDCGWTAAVLNVLICLCSFFSYTWLVIFDEIKQSCNVLFQMLGQGSTRGCSGSSGKFVDVPSLQIGQMVADFVQLNTVTLGYVHSYLLWLYGFMSIIGHKLSIICNLENMSIPLKNQKIFSVYEKGGSFCKRQTTAGPHWKKPTGRL